MARMTADERAQLEALSKRAKDEDDQDAGFTVKARNAKGIEVEYRGAEARSFLKRHGFEEDQDDAEEGADEEGEQQDEPPAEDRRYFKGRSKAPAKSDQQ